MTTHRKERRTRKDTENFPWLNELDRQVLEPPRLFTGCISWTWKRRLVTDWRLKVHWTGMPGAMSPDRGALR
jgi:hypothetical protein